MYLLSLRDQAQVPSAIQLHERQVSGFAEVEPPTWCSRMDWNFESGLERLRESEALTTDLIFVPLKPQLVYCLVVLEPFSELEAVVRKAGQRGILTTRLPSVRFGHRVFVGSSPEELSGLFGPAERRSLSDSLCIAMDRPRNLNLSESDFGLVGRLFRATDPEELLRIWADRPPKWLYCVRIDPAFFDVGDPVYCLPRKWHLQMSRHLHALCRRHGYRCFDLPLDANVIWSWLLRGEIPVLRRV